MRIDRKVRWVTCRSCMWTFYPHHIQIPACSCPIFVASLSLNPSSFITTRCFGLFPLDIWLTVTISQNWKHCCPFAVRFAPEILPVGFIYGCTLSKLGSVLICFLCLAIVFGVATHLPAAPGVAIKSREIGHFPSIPERRFPFPLESVLVVNHTVKVDEQTTFIDRARSLPQRDAFVTHTIFGTFTIIDVRPGRIPSNDLSVFVQQWLVADQKPTVPAVFPQNSLLVFERNCTGRCCQ